MCGVELASDQYVFDFVIQPHLVQTKTYAASYGSGDYFGAISAYNVALDHAVLKIADVFDRIGASSSAKMRDVLNNLRIQKSTVANRLN